MAMQQALKIFDIEREPDAIQAVALNKSPAMLVPVRRISQMQEDELMDPQTTVAADSLQQQLDERTAQLHAAQEQLVKSNLDFQEFTSAVSHDLQAPLRAIAGFSQFLQDEYQASLDETADQYLTHVVTGASRMQQLINGLVQFARVTSRGETLKNLSLNKVLKDAVAELHGEIACQHATIECGDLPDIFGDHNQLKCLFKNLIQNGITFNKSDKPEICIEARQVDGDWLVSVEDNGIGIADKNLEKVFAIFRRLHTREQFDGVGVGLAVSRRIVTRHGGTIQLSSELEVGTKATIMFPSAVDESVC